MNLKGFRVAMSVIAAALLAMMLSGCGGDDDGLSAEDMARIAAAEDAAMMAQEDADAAEMAAAAAEAEAEQAKMDAAAAAAEAEKVLKALADAAAAQEAADMAQAELDAEPEPVPDPGYQSTDPGGTLEGAEGRAAAQRIEEAMVAAPLKRETQDRPNWLDRSHR